MSGHTIGCGVSAEEKAEIVAYIAVKKRWKTIPAFVRDACYQHMARNPLSRAQQAKVDAILGVSPEPRLAVLRGGSEGNLKEAEG
jgi:hypothetical protein